MEADEVETMSEDGRGEKKDWEEVTQISSSISSSEKNSGVTEIVEKSSWEEESKVSTVKSSKFLNRDSIKVARKRFTTSSSLNYGEGGASVHRIHLYERPEELHESPLTEDTDFSNKEFISEAVHIIDDEPVTHPFDPTKEPKRGILKKRWSSSTGSVGAQSQSQDNDEYDQEESVNSN